MDENTSRLKGYGIAVPHDSVTGKETAIKAKKNATKVLEESDSFILFSRTGSQSTCASCVSSGPHSISEFLLMMMEWMKQVKQMRKNTIEEEMDDSIQPLLDEMQQEIKKVIETVSIKTITPKKAEQKAKELMRHIQSDTTALAVCQTIRCEVKRVGAEKVIEELNKILPSDLPEAEHGVFEGLMQSLKVAMPLGLIKAFLNKESK